MPVKLRPFAFLGPVSGAWAFWPTLSSEFPSLLVIEPYAAGLGIILFVSGCGLAIYDYGGHMISALKGRFIGEWVYDCRKATESDALYIDQLSSKRIGRTTSDIAAIRRMIALDMVLTYLIFRERTVGNTRSEQKCGYFILFPLSSTGLERLNAGTFNAPNPDESDLVEPKQSRVIYIGEVAAEDDHKMQHKAMDLMLGHLRSSDFRNVSHIYARAGTPVGLRLMELRKFIPANPDRAGLNQIYKREV